MKTIKSKKRQPRKRLRAAPGSATAIEDARTRLVGAACIYGAGYHLLSKHPQLGEAECFRAVMDESASLLKAAARSYYATIGESPNAESSNSREDNL